MGGLDHCSEIKLGLVRRLAATTVQAEMLEARMVNGEAIDIATVTLVAQALTFIQEAKADHEFKTFVRQLQTPSFRKSHPAWESHSSYGMRADHQKAPQVVSVALLGNRPKLLFASCRILSRHKPDPGRKIATRPECARVRNSGHDRACAQNADPGDASKPFARLVRAMLRDDPLLDCSDHRLQRLKLRRQYDQARSRVDQQAFIRTLR
jgi:hypothetical protein